MSFKPIYKILDWIVSINSCDETDIKYSFSQLCKNKNPIAITILENNIDKINWDYLSYNENAIHLLEKNLDKVECFLDNLYFNKKSFNLIKKFENNINWTLSKCYYHPYISSILHEKLKKMI